MWLIEQQLHYLCHFDSCQDPLSKRSKTHRDFDHGTRKLSSRSDPHLSYDTIVSLRNQSMTEARDAVDSTKDLVVVRRLIYSLQHGCVALGDTIVTVTIAACLLKSKTGWKDTDRLIKRLLLYVPISLSSHLTNRYPDHLTSPRHPLTIELKLHASN